MVSFRVLFLDCCLSSVGLQFGITVVLLVVVVVGVTAVVVVLLFDVSSREFVSFRFFVFGLGQNSLVGGIAIGRVLAGVVSSCYCCFSKSNNLKRLSQNSVPPQSKSEDKSSIKISRTASLVL